MNAGITDKHYLELMLGSKKRELEEVKIQHRIASAEYNVRTEMLNAQIRSIEIQLESGVRDND